MQEGKILVIFLVCDLCIPNSTSNSHIKDLSIEKKIKGKINNKNTDIITHDLNYMESAMFINFSFWLRYWGPLQILESGATTKILKKKRIELWWNFQAFKTWSEHREFVRSSLLVLFLQSCCCQRLQVWTVLVFLVSSFWKLCNSWHTLVTKNHNFLVSHTVQKHCQRRGIGKRRASNS